MLLTAAAILDGGTPQTPEIVVLAPLTTTAERFAVERAEELRRAAAVAAGRAATGLEYYGPGQATVAVMRSVLARLSSGSRPAVFVFAGSTTEAGGRFYELSD